MRLLISRHRRVLAALLAAASATFGLLALRPDRPAPAAGHRARRPTPPPGLGPAPVRIADAGTVQLISPGDHIDVITAGSTGTRLLAASVPVLAVPRRVQGEQGALVVLAVPRTQAVHLAAGTQRLSFALVPES
jgi:hypothetical protein